MAPICRLLNLIALGSVETMKTINGIFGVTASAIDMSHIIVIAGRLDYSDNISLEKGSFHLGQTQRPINIIPIAGVFCIYVTLFFPPTYPATAEDINYAVAVAGFTLVFATSW